MSGPGTQLMKISEMAKAYSFSETTIRQAIHAGKLYAFKPQLKGKNGHWRIRQSDADAWVEEMIEEFERSERDRLRAA